MDKNKPDSPMHFKVHTVLCFLLYKLRAKCTYRTFSECIYINIYIYIINIYINKSNYKLYYQIFIKWLNFLLTL